MGTVTEPTSRILIHAGATSKDEVAGHPSWRGENDRVLEDCSFATSFESGEGSIDSKEAMTEINYKIEHVLDKAPSDATANLILKKTRDGGYRAFFKVRSAQAKFAGFIRGNSLIDVVDKVVKQVRTQIDDWKQSRQLADETV